jgi:acyl-CoA thioesterase FadM
VVEHSEPFRVQWVDTDAGGRIHFTAPFRWAEATELALYRCIGLPKDAIGDLPRRHVEADYLRVLVFDDEIELRLHVARVGTTSITYEWTALHRGEAAIEGRHTVVHVDGDGRPAPIDDVLRGPLSR